MALDYSWTETQDDDKDEPRIAVAPDLISSLLSFDANELAGDSGDAHPEDMFVHRAAELRKWKLIGERPRYVAEDWIEIVVTGRSQGYCRILNSRTHEHLNPFTLDALIRHVEKLRAWIQTYESDAAFPDRLLAAYDTLADAPGSAVPLYEVFRLLNARQPSYRRECFGLDLARCLAKSQSLQGRHVRLAYAGGTPTQRFALCLSPRRGARLADQILIDAPSQLMSLDI